MRKPGTAVPGAELDSRSPARDGTASCDDDWLTDGDPSSGLLLLVQKSPQPRISTAANWKLLPTAQHDDILIFTIGLNFRVPLQVHDVRPVDAKKALRIKSTLQAGNSLLLQMFLSLGAQGDIIILRFRIVELRHRNDVDAGAILYHQTFQKLRRRPRTGSQLCRSGQLATQSLLRALQRGFKPLSRKRL